MKIDNTTNPLTGASVGTVRNGGTAKASGNTPAGSASDVHLSNASADLVTAGEAPSVDVARISEIKQAISEGRFTINSGAIADRLIASARELINARRQG